MEPADSKEIYTPLVSFPFGLLAQKMGCPSALTESQTKASTALGIGTWWSGRLTLLLFRGHFLATSCRP